MTRRCADGLGTGRLLALGMVLVLLLSSCSNGAAEETIDPNPTSQPSAESAESSSWLVRSYKLANGGLDPVGIGVAELNGEGAVVALRASLASEEAAGEVAMSETGIYLAPVTPPGIRPLADDGRQWVRFSDPSAADGVDVLPLLFPGEAAVLRTEKGDSGPMDVVPSGGQLVTDGQDWYVTVGEEWLDDEGAAQRRVWSTALGVGPDQRGGFVTVLDRRDDLTAAVPHAWEAFPSSALGSTSSAGSSNGIAAPAGHPPNPREGYTVQPANFLTQAPCRPAVTVSEGRSLSVRAGTCSDDVVLPSEIKLPDPPDPNKDDLDAIQDQIQSLTTQVQQNEASRQADEAAGARSACGWNIFNSILGLSALVAPEVVTGMPLFIGATLTPVGWGLLAGAVILGGGAAGLGASLVCSESVGDPHITTADGLRFDFQAIGEFTTVVSEPIVLQQRLEGLKGVATSTRAVAVAVGADVVEVRRGSDQPVVVNGVAEPLSMGVTSLPGAGTIEVMAGEYPGDYYVTIMSPEGSYVGVYSGGASLDVTSVLTVDAATSAGGLLGTPDGEHTNDFTTADGQTLTLAEARTIEGLYGRFGDSWRVQPEDRLFTDGDPADWATEDILALPGRKAALSDFDPDQIEQARQTCLDAGVPASARLDECAFDVLASGDSAFAEQAGGTSAEDTPAMGGGDAEADSPLLAAAFRCDVDGTRDILAAGTSPNVAREDGVTPLYLASQEGCSEVVQALLESGASVEARTNDGANPLYVSAQNGNLDVVRLLLDYGANPGSAADSGQTPLLAASYFGHEESARVLLEHGAPVDVARLADGFTPLLAASQNGYRGIVMLLLEYGADPERPDNDGQPAVMSATGGNYADIVELLAAEGADVNRGRATDGITALHLAEYLGAEETIKVLLEAGADPNARDDDGRIPEDYAS